ncbi:hypothetical protein [Streptomyces caatingaensis]|uniref:Uncharacterized protein n=1 Tax=Streptomyces caatingaensis TaxID=1678637 RepID=A0A0K9XFT3_9ACTN|nr:hypothetical protein [Streptomyces caatingaensis]KNB52230.1 hypothetical protein AC230_11795 [Streptomyces caatingaensis]
MDDPVFVIHGVGNRDEEGFARTVAGLRAATGLGLVPVYWGDLGADDRYVDLALPRRTPPDTGLRDEAGAPPDPETAAVLESVLDAPAPPDAEEPPPALADALRAGLENNDDGLRGPGGPDPDDVLAELAELWPEARWLSRVDDPGLLRAAGTALAAAVTEEDDSWDGLRGGGDGRLRALLRRRLRDLDRVAGAAVEAVAGRVNRQLRAHYGPGATRFLGDVLVYQRHRAAVHARIRERIAAVDPELGGGPERPVRVVAHSLGGVIAVDMATAGEPLWTSSLLTFGSQPAYFHLCDPRGGQLSPYAGEESVALPRSLARWTNLWQPLDPLAFAASRVFRLADGTPPADVALPHTIGAGLWTHSAYWRLPEVAEAVREAFAVPAGRG